MCDQGGGVGSPSMGRTLAHIVELAGEAAAEWIQDALFQALDASLEAASVAARLSDQPPPALGDPRVWGGVARDDVVSVLHIVLALVAGPPEHLLRPTPRRPAHVLPPDLADDDIAIVADVQAPPKQVEWLWKAANILDALARCARLEEAWDEALQAHVKSATDLLHRYSVL